MARLPDNMDKVAQVRGNIRAETRVGWSLLMAIAIVSVLFIGIAKFHLPMESTGIVAFAVLLAWLAFAFRAQRKITPRAGHENEEILRKTIDDQHRRWRWYFTLTFLLLGFLAFMSSFVALMLPLSAHPKVAPVTLGTSANLMLWAVVVAFQVCFGPTFGMRNYRRAVNDELTRALQGKAAMFGYLLSIVMMSVGLAITSFRWQWGLAAMPAAIATVVILPGFYFLVLQWRAGRDG
jgi:hypothetical protein